ncbi:HU family DNA-binding protein [uncultured Serinicoccus sp.]|uniref:HU family DNA-binding protein n=1 Tax=uncultured Serinicoccus sp. TaxID=735514 RepID=UPI00262CFDF7|nr:HU family DNA-binding protein [uncultured Serinicoccus sp.]
MNKADLIEALAPRLGGRAAATAAVEALVDVVLREVASGGSVAITGFGTFERVQRAPRTGRNPRTGERVPIARTTTPRFRPGSYFKDVVADPAGLPAEGSAGVRGAVVDGAASRSGAPPSVRRSAGEEARGGRAAPASREGRASKRAASGTPSSVRKETPSDAAPVESEAGPSAPGGAGLVFAGGEDITAGMISAKKAQLARVKNDQVIAESTSSSSKKKKNKGGKGKKKGQDGKGKGKATSTNKGKGKG